MRKDLINGTSMFLSSSGRPEVGVQATSRVCALNSLSVYLDFILKLTKTLLSSVEILGVELNVIMCKKL